MEKKTYFLAVYENELGTFSGRFADFECVCDDGDTLEKLIYNAKELLNFTVAYMVEHKQPLPEPSAGREFKAKLEQEPFCIVPVSIYPPAKTERINIAAPGDKIAEITDFAKKSKLSRSELMVNATLEYIRANA
jgi:predicted RNase H-like HicB family nuclease